MTPWTDPVTGKAFLIDGRTGNSREASTQEEDEEGVVDRRMSLRRTHNESEHPDFAPPWILETLRVSTHLCFISLGHHLCYIKSWENPIFPHTEANIPMTSMPSSESLGLWNTFGGRGPRGTPKSRFFDPSVPSITRRFTKQDLKNAKVISQVDDKFIACLISSTHSAGVLVLIDQHAADERVRVERFLKDLCEGFLQGRMLTRDLSACPTRLLLSRAEAARLAKSYHAYDALERWGIRVAVPALVMEGQDDGGSYVQVEVTSLPEVVADKVR